MGFEHSPKRVFAELLLFAAVLVAVGWGALIGIRSLAVRTVQKLPRRIDQELGAVFLKQVQAGAHECRNPRLQSAVREITAVLARANPQVGALSVHAILEDTVNAFALPGGGVFVHSGLLSKVERPEELAGVLGHELGHVALRHSLVRLVETMGLNRVVALIFGWDEFVNLLTGTAANLASLKYSRQMEAEADDFGVIALTRAEIDPSGLPSFFAKMESQHVPEWLLTHPDPENRRQRLLAATTSQKTRAKLPPLLDLKLPCD